MKHTTFFVAFLFSSIAIFGQEKKNVGITLSFPWINNYCYFDYSINKSKVKSGFAGIGASIFYRFKKSKLSLNIGFTNDIPAPFGAFDYAKEISRVNINSSFAEILYHKNLNKHLNGIVGLNFINYKYIFTTSGVTTSTSVVNDKTLGVTIGTEFAFSKHFALALLYKPTILSLNTKHYRHLISLDARFDINFFNIK